MAEVYKAKWILTAAENDYEPLYEDCALIVEDGKISDIVRQSEIYEEVFDKVEDFGNAVITPGFINLDAGYEKPADKKGFKRVVLSVIQFFKMLGTPTNSYPMKLAELYKNYLLDDEKIKTFKEGLSKSLLAGTTCVLKVVKNDKYEKKCFEILNKTPMKTFFLFDIYSDSVKNSKKAFYKLKKKVKKFGKTLSNSTYLGFYPHAIWSVHKKLLHILSKYTKRNNFVMMFELFESRQELEWFEKGKSDLDYLNNFYGYKKLNPPENTTINEFLSKFISDNVIVQNCNFLNTNELDFIAQSGAGFAYSPDRNKNLFEKTHLFDTILRYFPQKTGFMTGSLANSVNILEELYTAKANMPVQDLIKYITLYPAKMLGIKNIAGSLEFNKHADFNVFKLDKKSKTPEDIQFNKTPCAVFILGKQVVKDGEICT